MQGITLTDVIELHDDAGHPSDYRSGTPMYSDIPESLTATLFPPSDLPISAFIDFAIPSVTSIPQANLPNIQQYFCLEPPHTIPTGHALLSSLPIPTESIVTALICMVPEARGTGKCSVIYAHTDSPYRYPFWLLAFWDKVAKDIIPPLMKWQAACRFVEQQSRSPEPSRSVASVFQMQLSVLPWQGDVCGFMDYSPIHNLAQFASRAGSATITLILLSNSFIGRSKVVMFSPHFPTSFKHTSSINLELSSSCATSKTISAQMIVCTFVRLGRM